MLEGISRQLEEDAMDDQRQLHINDGGKARPEGGGASGYDADIVVGLDGSPESFAALRWALREAECSRQRVNAVFGWTPSWELGAEPDNDKDWDTMRERMLGRLHGWVKEASKGLDIDLGKIELTPERASGEAALLRIGSHAQQIVVGRRSMGRVMRWLTNSTSSSLAEESQVPVTIVRGADADEHDVQGGIAAALGPTVLGPAAGDDRVKPENGSGAEAAGRTIVVGVDGSPAADRALRFAICRAALHHASVHAVYCWQFKELGVIPGYENAIAPIEAGQEYAAKLVRDIVTARIHDSPATAEALSISTHAFHVSAVKGLLSASRYTDHIVIGTRGLGGLDAHFLGSVSRQVVNLAQCTVTVVH
ncbi:universal stress protein [Bifidobacterium sp.]|jgi:nucleotide-binding universal stress UspA family protein|uniref:universal stress protein n=1 Tax=Bifidobacterium sp. TaxID=41200 RepID=UPI0025C4088A|nr:universal stress protein [Bifidobacterium sp.]MCH4208656.1 universal stress protein [Bifidobacterium sp.]MCI1224372.1 universal stress protein [Bifidobacterium sp.]